MSNYFSTTMQTTFVDAVTRVTDALRKEGFGIMTAVDVADTLKKKLNIDFRQYVILGACNPQIAYRALEAEDKVGTLLPCSVIVQEIPGVGAEVAVLDPAAALRAAGNPALEALAIEAREKLRRAVRNCA